MAMTSLPRFFVLQAPSGGPYLCPVENPLTNRPSSLLRCGESQILSPRVKFATELSKTGDVTLVHIRSCFNNKYWVAHKSQGTFWIVAAADKPHEDTTNPACTLFRAYSNLTSQKTPRFQFLSICKSMYVVNVGDSVGGLALESDEGHTFPTVDWETLVILPSKVSFKSDDLSGNYLCSRVQDRYYNYHKFEPGLDIGDPRVAHELFPTSNGNYRIKSLYYGKFWRRSPNWIWADAEENDHSNDTLFSFVKISDKLFALRNLGNNYFCGALTTEGKTNCLNAHYPTMSRQTRLMVEERTLQRDISNVRYRLSHSRIYQEEIQEVSHAFATNDSLDKETTITLTYSISDSRTATWTNSVSMTFGIKATFAVDSIPLIAKNGIEVSSEFSHMHQWGEANTTEQKRESSYAVLVPPLTTMKVTLMCTKAACDVPFSYTQHDLLTNGERLTTVKDDGVYTGINSYNFYFQSSEVDKVGQPRTLALANPDFKDSEVDKVDQGRTLALANPDFTVKDKRVRLYIKLLFVMFIGRVTYKLFHNLFSK
ncbi:putative aerolysin, Agglutinin domain, Agglutinin domain superfamily [Helianthus anomalus]